MLLLHVPIQVKQFYVIQWECFAGGNTVVFNPHPAAIKTSIYAINLLNEASLESGGPDNIAVTVEKPTLETSNVMMKHKDIPLIAATGGPGVVTAVLSSGKREFKI